MSSRKIELWHNAGLIDDETRARLIAYEADHARPLALWAVFGIGALAIGLGLISVVAANWEAIPGELRLGVHLALIAAGCAALLWKGAALDAVSPWLSEALVFVLAVLGLTFFGHLGQVYQTSSPLWQPVAVWLVLFGPLIALYGRSWPTAALLFGFFAYACWDFGIWLEPELDVSPDAWWQFTLITAVPVLLTPIAAYLRSHSRNADFWVRLEQLALAYAVAMTSVMLAGAALERFDEPIIDLPSQALRLAVGLIGALGVYVARRNVSGQMTAAILAGAGVSLVLAVPVSDSSVPAAILFMAFWTGIAAAALKAEWRREFQLAVAVIALRLIVLSFELGGDLLLSGFGLIVSGILILGVAWVAVRVSRTFAPAASDEGESA